MVIGEKKKKEKKKKKELSNATKVSPNVRNLLSNVMLVLPNMTMEPSNVRKREGDHQM